MKIKLFTTVFVLLLSALAVQAQKKTEMNSKEIYSLLKKDPKLIVLDVRTPEEFSAGHIKGAINIDVYQQNALTRINKLDRNANYVVYCRTKNRSGVVVEHMMKNGFKTIYHMMDGYSGWSQNKLPVEK